MLCGAAQSADQTGRRDSQILGQFTTWSRLPRGVGGVKRRRGRGLRGQSVIHSHRLQRLRGQRGIIQTICITIWRLLERTSTKVIYLFYTSMRLNGEQMESLLLLRCFSKIPQDLLSLEISNVSNCAQIYQDTKVCNEKMSPVSKWTQTFEFFSHQFFFLPRQNCLTYAVNLRKNMWKKKHLKINKIIIIIIIIISSSSIIKKYIKIIQLIKKIMAIIFTASNNIFTQNMHFCHFIRGIISLEVLVH